MSTVKTVDSSSFVPWYKNPRNKLEHLNLNFDSAKLYYKELRTPKFKPRSVNVPDNVKALILTGQFLKARGKGVKAVYKDLKLYFQPSYVAGKPVEHFQYFGRLASPTGYNSCFFYSGEQNPDIYIDALPEIVKDHYENLRGFKKWEKPKKENNQLNLNF